jgi:hypothetical protein
LVTVTKISSSAASIAIISPAVGTLAGRAYPQVSSYSGVVARRIA